MDQPIILASGSPRRAELLASAGFIFTVHPAEVDERPVPGERPEPYVLRVARAKARAIVDRVGKTGRIVLAADTTVVVSGEMLGKPRDTDDAARMLHSLSGTVHEVLTVLSWSPPIAKIRRSCGRASAFSRSARRRSRGTFKAARLTEKRAPTAFRAARRALSTGSTVLVQRGRAAEPTVYQMLKNATA